MHDLRNMADMARNIGEDADAAKYSARHSTTTILGCVFLSSLPNLNETLGMLNRRRELTLPRPTANSSA